MSTEGCRFTVEVFITEVCTKLNICRTDTIDFSQELYENDAKIEQFGAKIQQFIANMKLNQVGQHFKCDQNERKHNELAYISSTANRSLKRYTNRLILVNGNVVSIKGPICSRTDIS